MFLSLSLGACNGGSTSSDENTSHSTNSDLVDNAPKQDDTGP